MEPEPSPNADDSDWPFPSFNRTPDWEERPRYHANVGLRHGLATAVRQLVEEENQAIARESEGDVLITAIFCMQEMRSRFDEELAWLIAEARYKGVSWAKIARALEMTRQAAHKRFSARVATILRHYVPDEQRHQREHREFLAQLELRRQERPESQQGAGGP